MQTRASQLGFALRVGAHQVLRSFRDFRVDLPVGDSVERTKRGWRIIGRSVTSLWAADMGDEARLTAGKVENLRIAARRIGRRRFAAGEVFSFWRHVGRPTRRAGFVQGREVREGCLVASIGGGLCQLSNGLYDAALDAGLDVVERHAHTVVVEGSLAERGRDATVFWRYVDLRLKAPHSYEIEARLTCDSLIVQVWAPRDRRVSLPIEGTARPAPTGSCTDCGRSACPSHSPERTRWTERVAFLVDRHTPEIDAWVRRARGPDDELMLPLDGRRFERARYAWSTDGFARVRSFSPIILARALASRRVGAQGAARQRTLLRFDEMLARSMARRLDPQIRHLVVQQSLLPFLAQAGALGGRSYDVLATRLPLHVLHGRLDEAAARHPASRTLSDFRAPANLVRAERLALASARRVVTAHAGIAAYFGPRAVRLPWQVGERHARRSGRQVVFLGPTVGRKGAYELREAARRLRLRLRVAGRDLEGGFDWAGVDVDDAGPHPLADAAVVVAPSHVENEPRHLLRAAQQGVPVIASAACGLDGVPGVQVVATGCVDALTAALRPHALLSRA